ncbi:MAG: patatin-like phospholipase family protein [Dehalococcoidales bacterium]
MSEERKKIGLALGSGAARGLAHIGVLKVLEQEGIHVDMIAGTSLGALVGAFYAYGQSVERMEKLAVDLGAKRLNFLFEPALPRTGLFRGRKIENALKVFIGGARFHDLNIPLACVATDINNGDEIVIEEGIVWEAVRASSSVPVILALVEREGRYLVDGTLVNPVPVSVVKAMGADFIIAVNVIPRGEMQGKAAPNLFTVVMQTLYISSYQFIQASLEGADIVIEPEVKEIGYADFHRAREGIFQGERAAKKAIPEIKRRYSAV